MRRMLAALALSLSAGLGIACSEGDDTNAASSQDPSDAASAMADGGVEGESVESGAADNPAGTGLNTGLPCDVQAVLENRCIACHDGTKARAMLTYGDLVAKSVLDATKTVAAVALTRMKDGSMPPKPAVPPDADEIAVFEAWVGAGTPRNTSACTDPPPSGAATLDAGPLPDGGDGGVVCTSGVLWTKGDDGSPLMHPGRACNACHQVQGGPNLRVAGTVYTASHEPDDCNGHGPPPALSVIVTGADGRAYTAPVNSAGNFFLERTKVKPPFRARVTDGTKSRAMAGSVTSGDCNSCHTVTGKNGAPGRILVP